jgi:hypothetical protein
MATALHRRRIDAGGDYAFRGTIDHLVVAPSGVWVVDAKTHDGPLEVRRNGGILDSRVERLFINNRDRTNLVETVQRQVAAVTQVLAEHDLPIHGAMCFVGTTRPWVAEEVGGIRLVGEDDLTKLVAQDGALDREKRALIVTLLKSRCQPA